MAAPGLPCDRHGGSLNLLGPLLAAVSWGAESGPVSKSAACRLHDLEAAILRSLPALTDNMGLVPEATRRAPCSRCPVNNDASVSGFVPATSHALPVPRSPLSAPLAELGSEMPAPHRAGSTTIPRALLP